MSATDGFVIGIGIMAALWIVVVVVGYIVIKIGDLLGKDW
jgi:hypothetical protein